MYSATEGGGGNLWCMEWGGGGLFMVHEGVGVIHGGLGVVGGNLWCMEAVVVIYSVWK